MRLFLFFLFSSLCHIVLAQKATHTPPLRKYAIVIGNAAYTKVSTLTAPTNDAETVADVLRDNCGFVVDKYQNIMEADVKNRLDKWRENAKKYDIVLFYFSGHGIVKNNEQYLLLTDSDRDDESIKKNLSISTIKQTLNPNGLNKTLLVIDACRSDDIDAKPDTIATRDKAPRKKGGGKGGDVPDKADGYLNTKTFFASSARHTSHDGNLYSYYTEILIKHLNTVADKKTVSPFFAGVKAEVVDKYKKQSDAVQFPNTEGDFSEEFYLKDAKCKKMVDCGLCKGTGMQETFEICRTCNGKGTTTCVGCEGKALTDKNYICLNCYHKPVICVHCQGNKRLSSFHECSNCHGQGQIEQEIDCK